jgi:hypothetical protein
MTNTIQLDFRNSMYFLTIAGKILPACLKTTFLKKFTLK